MLCCRRCTFSSRGDGSRAQGTGCYSVSQPSRQPWRLLVLVLCPACWRLLARVMKQCSNLFVWAPCTLVWHIAAGCGLLGLRGCLHSLLRLTLFLGFITAAISLLPRCVRGSKVMLLFVAGLHTGRIRASSPRQRELMRACSQTPDQLAASSVLLLATACVDMPVLLAAACKSRWQQGRSLAQLQRPGMLWLCRVVAVAGVTARHRSVTCKHHVQALLRRVLWYKEALLARQDHC